MSEQMYRYRTVNGSIPRIKDGVAPKESVPHQDKQYRKSDSLIQERLISPIGAPDFEVSTEETQKKKGK